MAEKGKIQNTFHRSARFTVGLLAATLVFELLLYAIEISPLWRVLPVAEVALYGPDSETGYTIRPNVSGVWVAENRARIQMSAQGLRDSDTPFEKPKGLWRIALAGDSITEALQVEESKTFANLLESHLSKKGREVEVINLGISGALPSVQVARMESVGVRFSPDLLVYMINISDFASPTLRTDSAFPGYRRDVSGEWRLSYAFRDTRGYHLRQSFIGQTLYWLLDHSRVMRIINARLNQGFGISDKKDDSAEVPSPPSCGVTVAGAVATALRQPNNAPEVRGAMDGFLRDVAVTAKRVGVPAVLAVRGLPQSCKGERETNRRLQADLEAHLRDFGIGMLDMDAVVIMAMNKAAMGDDINVLYGFGTRVGFGHLNHKGHDIYSRALADGLAPWINGLSEGM
ncbi:SGNH/GDSL hydrolase family protein [Pseudomonadota bacterium]